MRLFIVEDDPLLRQNLTLLLGGEAGIEVVGSAGSAEEALEAILRDEPEVVLSDLGLPGRSGVELIADLKAQLPDLEVMAYTVFDDRPTVFAAIKAGASSYILKDSTPRELVEALRSLRDGGAPMSPRIARQVVLELQGAQASDPYLLSRRERDVLAGIERGLTYKEIAGELALSPHTVHSHIKRIYDKLHAKTRQEALRKARRRGVL